MKITVCRVDHGNKLLYYKGRQDVIITVSYFYRRNRQLMPLFHWPSTATQVPGWEGSTNLSTMKTEDAGVKFIVIPNALVNTSVYHY